MNITPRNLYLIPKIIITQTFLLLVLLSGCSGGGTEGTGTGGKTNLRGIVIDTNKAPISQVFVSTIETGQPAITNEEGEFTIEIPGIANNIDLIVRKDDIEAPVSIKPEVESEATIDVEIELDIQKKSATVTDLNVQITSESLGSKESDTQPPKRPKVPKNPKGEVSNTDEDKSEDEEQAGDSESTQSTELIEEANESDGVMGRVVLGEDCTGVFETIGNNVVQVSNFPRPSFPEGTPNGIVWCTLEFSANTTFKNGTVEALLQYRGCDELQWRTARILERIEVSDYFGRIDRRQLLSFSTHAQCDYRVVFARALNERENGSSSLNPQENQQFLLNAQDNGDTVSVVDFDTYVELLE